MTRLRSHLWLAYLALAVAAIVVDLRMTTTTPQAALYFVVGASGLVAAAVGIGLHRPRDRTGWCLILASLSLWTVELAFWQGYILAHHGATAPLSSWWNFDFLGLYPLFIPALLYLLRRRERDWVGPVDASIIAAAALSVAWVALVNKYTTGGQFSAGLGAIQTAFAVGDVILFAVLVRLAVSTGRRSPAFVLLVGSGVCYLFSNVTWNWASLIGNYTAGSWGNTGWLMFPVVVGAAALHPSMRSLFEPHPRVERRLSWSRIALLTLASLVAPTIVAVYALQDRPVQRLLVVAAAAAVVGLLVLLKMALVLRQEVSLTRALAAQQEQLAELDRRRELDALKDSFVASVSHELRTPLTSIRGYLDLVLEGEAGELTDEQRHFLGVVERNSERLLRLVGDLLFVAQVDAGKLALELEPVDLLQLVEESVQSARPYAETKQIELLLDAQSVPPLDADCARLAQLLDNLVSNALKFTPPGGRVTLGLSERAGSVLLEVADTGMGIPASEHGLLFDRFYRAKGATEQAIQGTGLGLSIAKAIVEAHGGRIGVQSVEGEGTTFRIELPIEQPTEMETTERMVTA